MPGSRTLLGVLIVWLAIAATVPAATAAGGRAGGGAPRADRARPGRLPPLAERVRQDSLRFAAGVNRASFDSLNASFIRDIADARRARDRSALRRLLVFQGAGHAMTGDGPRAIAVLEEALPMIEADADTSWLLVALRWRAYAAGSLGRLDEQERAARRMVAIAEAGGNARFLAIGNNFLGWIARQRGDLRQARAYLERAVEGHRALRNESEEAFARIAYGATLTDLGEYVAARRSYARQLEIARRLKQGWTEAQAYNDVGVLERRIGDPGKAADYFRRGYDGLRARGETPDLAAALDNLASVELELGRAESARELARQGIELCERRGFTRVRGNLLVLLGSAENMLDRHVAAAAAWRRVIAMGDSAQPESRAYAVLGLSHALLEKGRKAEALAAIEEAAPALLPRVGRDDAARFNLGWSHRLAHVGRYAGSVEAARRALAGMRGAPPSQITVSAWGLIANVRWQQGQMAESKAAYDSACALWELQRSRSVDPEWRASLWSQPGAVRLGATAILLQWPPTAPETTRVAAAYERLQQFRSRTLLEQSSRPGEGDAPVAVVPAARWGAPRVQRELLADGELLLEWAVGEDAAYVFALTRDQRRAFRLGDAATLAARIRTACDLLSARPRGADEEAATTRIARELATVVFGDALPMVERARSLVLVPDGPLHRVPFAALGTRAGTLLASRSIAIAPSVALLGESRRRAAAAGRGLLAVSMTGNGERRLVGAEREVAWLASAFDGVERAEMGVRDPAAFAATLSRYDALHFAGHTEYDDRFPWRSGIDVGAPQSNDAIDEPTALPTRGARAGRPLLRAETIASTPIAARLVVLSSCETAAGRILAGEGLAGLSTAFLAGGARAVVASLWPVDDRATETLMREFYRVLGTGRNASAALRMAQNRVRQDRLTRHPWYWAGFVLVGDGAVTVPLKPAPLWRRALQGKPLGDRTPGRPARGADTALASTPGAGL